MAGYMVGSLATSEAVAITYKTMLALEITESVMEQVQSVAKGDADRDSVTLWAARLKGKVTSAFSFAVGILMTTGQASFVHRGVTVNSFEFMGCVRESYLEVVRLIEEGLAK